MAKETPTSVQYRISEGDFTLIATVSLPSGRITLEKAEGMGGNRKDYHFEQSTVEKVEAFAKCAQRAVELSRIVVKAGVKAGYSKAEEKPKKGKK